MIGSPSRPDDAVVVVSAEVVVVLGGMAVVVVDDVVTGIVVTVVDEKVAAVLSGEPQPTRTTANASVETKDKDCLNCHLTVARFNAQ